MIFPILLIIVLLNIIGLSFIKIFNLMPNIPLMTRVSYAYGIGIGLVSFQMLIYFYLQIVYNPFLLLIPWLIFILFAFIKTKKKITINKQIHLDTISKIILIGILLTIFFVIFEASIRPLSAWDAWATWFIAGKAFYLTHSFDPNFYPYAHFSVQPVPIFFLTFVFTLLGQVNDQSTLFLFTGFYLSLLLMLYSTLRKTASVKISLLFVFLFATLGNVIRHAGRYDVGYIDLPLAYFFFACFLLLNQLNERFSYKTLILLNFLLAVTALVKSEGLPYFLIIQALIIFQLIKVKKIKGIFFSFISLLLVASWPVFMILNHLPQYSLYNMHIFFDRISLITEKILNEFLNIQRWNLLWPTFIISILIARYTPTLKLLAIVICAQSVTYYLAYLTTYIDPLERIGGSLDRLLLQISPLVLFFIALTTLQVKNSKFLRSKIIK